MTAEYSVSRKKRDWINRLFQEIGCLDPGFTSPRLPDEVFISQFAHAWEDYYSQKQAALKTTTGRLMRRANMSRFVKDVDWGEVAAGALGCYCRGFEPDPARVRWKIIRSERKGKNTQEITASAPFYSSCKMRAHIGHRLLCLFRSIQS